MASELVPGAPSPQEATLEDRNATGDGRRETATSATDFSRSRFVTFALAGLLVWLPLQTPVAVVAFQYGGLTAEGGRVILLLKDAWVGLLFAYLLAVTWRDLRFTWFDRFALLYAALVIVYSVVPYLFGSNLPLQSVGASARQFLIPVELYGLGRLAVLHGARTPVLLAAFMAVSVVAAVVTVAVYLFAPATFWSTTLDLVTFEREVQGLAGATSLWNIGLLGHYGVGSTAEFTRGIGPFIHPVAAAHYLVTPLLIATAAVFSWRGQRPLVTRALWAVAAGLLATAILVAISRGSWIAAAIGVLAIGAVYRRIIPAAIAVGIVGVFVLTVPPFSLSMSSALDATDSSVVGHQLAVEHGFVAFLENPLGLGLGQADHFGSAFAGSEGESAGVGENLYLALLISVGPVGLLALAGWLLGLAMSFMSALRGASTPWWHVGVAAALLGYLISGLTASSLMRFTTSASFWLFAGVAIGAILQARSSGQKHEVSIHRTNPSPTAFASPKES